MSERRVVIYSQSDTPPDNPFFAERWLNTIDGVEYVFNGSDWQKHGIGQIGMGLAQDRITELEERVASLEAELKSLKGPPKRD